MANTTRILPFLVALTAACSPAVAVVIDARYEWDREITIDVLYFPEDAVPKSDYGEPGVPGNLYVYTVSRSPSPPLPCIEGQPCGSGSFFLTLFGIANPDGFGGTMFSPDGWSASVDSQRFVWETFSEEPALGSGESLVFRLFSPGPYGVLRTLGQAGQAELTAWPVKGSGEIETRTVLGAMSGPLEPSPVPEPTSLLLFGTAVLAFGRRLRSPRG